MICHCLDSDSVAILMVVILVVGGLLLALTMRR
jgi:hypothetical protein